MATPPDNKRRGRILKLAEAEAAAAAESEMVIGRASRAARR